MYVLGRILSVIVTVVIAVVVICVGYMIYLNISSARIPDVEPAMPGEYNGALYSGATDSKIKYVTSPALSVGKTYHAATWDIGYGAADKDFSFFMSENTTVEGDPTKGTMSHARDSSAVKRNIASVAAFLTGSAIDFAVIQDVDKDASRTHHINEADMIAQALMYSAMEKMPGMSVFSSYATNGHTGWMLFPPANPIGQIHDSGIITFSNFKIDKDSITRYSLPVNESFPNKFFDLDRCFMTTSIPVEKKDSKLVVINVHMSAYDQEGTIKDAQMKKILGVMQVEREKGNWVIAGGNWNLCFPGSADAFKGRMEVPAWATSMKEDLIPEGFSIVAASNADVVATCRDTSIPWTAGVNYETIVDGWIVSDNVTAFAENIDMDYVASSHNPVVLKFALH